MQVTGVGLAPGPQFSQKQHRRRTRRRLLYLFAQRLGHLALADGNGDRRPLSARGQAPAPRIEGPFHRPQQFGQRQRFFDEIEGPQARGLHGGLHRAVTGHHDHRAVVAVGGRPFPQQGDAVGVRHPDIQEHEVGDLGGPRRPGLGGVRRHIHLVPLFGENLFQQPADIRLVVHHQYSRSGHTRSLLCSLLRASRTPTERALSPSGNRIRTRAPPVR